MKIISKNIITFPDRTILFHISIAGNNHKTYQHKLNQYKINKNKHLKNQNVAC